VALMKLFDRVHNLQTLGVKSPEKARKIIEETVKNFIIIAMHLKIPTITQDLTALCYKNLSIQQFNQHNHQNSMDNSPPLSPTFQNVIARMRTPQL
jgi:(p)ppGpp synthase/HD superfamily hydrolase